MTGWPGSEVEYVGEVNLVAIGNAVLIGTLRALGLPQEPGDYAPDRRLAFERAIVTPTCCVACLTQRIIAAVGDHGHDWVSRIHDDLRVLDGDA